MRFPFFLLVAVAACEAVPPAPPVVDPLPSSGEDTCAAAQYAHLIGQDATELEEVLLMGQVRVIRPGMAVTMDYRPNRINFNIDESARITRINCG